MISSSAIYIICIVPGSFLLRNEEWPESQQDEILPFSVEKQLSDDIAFISAYEYGVRYVTVATVQASEREGLTIRLAANEGVSACVDHALRRIFLLLEGCSSKELPRQHCAEAMFDIVVGLSTNGILERLASKHFRRPEHERGRTREPLSVRLNSVSLHGRANQRPKSGRFSSR